MKKLLCCVALVGMSVTSSALAGSYINDQRGGEEFLASLPLAQRAMIECKEKVMHSELRTQNSLLWEIHEWIEAQQRADLASGLRELELRYPEVYLAVLAHWAGLSNDDSYLSDQRYRSVMDSAESERLLTLKQRTFDRIEIQRKEIEAALTFCERFIN